MADVPNPALRMETAMTAQYPVLPIAAGTLARAFAGSLSLATRSVNAVARALRNRREANVLAGLDRHMLADIGLTQSDVQDAFSEPLWQDPTALLNERAIERRMDRALKRAPRWAGAEDGFQQPATNRPARQTV
jgi:uncharacterized protein YjiS (DUF1127 family)